MLLVLREYQSLLVSSWYHIFFLLPLHYYSGNIYLLSSFLSPSPSLFFISPPAPLSLSLFHSLPLPFSATHPLKQSYPLSLSGSPCLSHSACEASLRGKTRLLCQVSKLGLFLSLSVFPSVSLSVFLSSSNPSLSSSLAPVFSSFSFHHHYYFTCQQWQMSFSLIAAVLGLWNCTCDGLLLQMCDVVFYNLAL